MTVHQCDRCSKTIDDGEAVSFLLGIGWKDVELCAECAKPVFDLLKEYEILKESSYKRLLKRSPKV